MLSRLWLIPLLIAACLCGCDTPKAGDVDEQKNPHFIEGKERAKARDYKGAIEAFQRALDANPNSALAHFELGMLYETHDDQNEWRYVLALYHYYRAYELRPNAYPADNAKLRIAACRQELAKTESLAPLYPSMQRELEKLREENSQLRRQVDFFQAQIVTQSSTFGPNDSRPTSPTRNSPPHNDAADTTARSPRNPVPTNRVAVATPAARKYVIKDRDTLASIARNNKMRLETLLAANPGVEPKRLKVGQIINIPSS